ncbi:MAG: c-type cytochrome [Kiloniellaceae bacterium]
MPKHGRRIILLIVVFLALGIAAKSYFTTESFYRYGHYRADSVPEIAAATPRYKGPAYCEQCHGERHAEWSAGVHKVVKCEVCHGPAGEHPQSGKLPIPTDTVRLCTLCHEAMPARPAAQPQIDVAEHAGAQQCVACHNPHSPRIGEAAKAEVVVAPVGVEKLLTKCAGCHGADGLGVGNFPPLAGKEAEYLAKQLHDFKTGARRNPIMNTIAKPLSDREIADLAAYYASLPGKKAK